MVVTIKLDVKCTVLYGVFLLVGGGALLLAFPALRAFLPKTSSDLASWVQALGGIAAIFFAGRYLSKQLLHADEQQRRVQNEADLSAIWACKNAAADAHRALVDLSKKLSGESKRPPSSSTERIEGLETTIRVLLASKPHPMAVGELLTILAELAYSRVAIRECSILSDRTEQLRKSSIRAEKVRNASGRLSLLYQVSKNPPSQRPR